MNVFISSVNGTCKSKADCCCCSIIKELVSSNLVKRNLCENNLQEKTNYMHDSVIGSDCELVY